MLIRILSIAAAFSAVAASAFAQQDSNPPWYPSLMAFEHYDSGRTHLFEQADFGGSFDGNNQVTFRTAPEIYPTGYNMVYLDPDNIFLYGGGYGNIQNAIGAFVAKVDPVTLRHDRPNGWYTQLTVIEGPNPWNYPGVVSLLNNGVLYVIYGYQVAALDPQTGKILEGPKKLPTGKALPENTTYNGFDALPNGTLIAKTIYRRRGCPIQGPQALFDCKFATLVPNSIMVSIDPQTLEVLDKVELDAPVGGRLTTAHFQGHDYVYLIALPSRKPNTPSAIRYLVNEHGQFTPDDSWNPGDIYEKGQTGGSAPVVMNDWFVVQTNGGQAQVPLSVIAINQADANRQFSAQPFKNFRVPRDYGYKSFAPFSVSVDPDHNLIYAADSAPGVIGALELTANSLTTRWIEKQRTTEFSALIGPPDRRVLVGTDMGDQMPANNKTDQVVWRNAQTGSELARSQELPGITRGTMVQPYYFGKIFYPGFEHGQLLELTVEEQ